jgi:hypothetical protein
MICHFKREKIAQWLYNELSDGCWSWENAPERKRGYYLNKASELMSTCQLQETEQELNQP